MVQKLKQRLKVTKDRQTQSQKDREKTQFATCPFDLGVKNIHALEDMATKQV